MPGKLMVTPVAASIHREGDSPIFGETVTTVCIDDDAGGPFVVLKQVRDDSKEGRVVLYPDEIDVVMDAAKRLLAAQPREKRQ